MKKLRKLKTKLRYSRDTVFVFSQLKKLDKADEAMTIHELKITFRTLLITVAIQSAIIILYWILSK